MKIVGLIASLFFTFFSIGQKSYYFSEPLPSIEKKIKTVDSKWFGTYNSKNVTRGYEFTKEGIFITSTSISSISRESIRESTTYDVRNNYIFGVIKDDSLPCVLDEERYYFGIKNRDVLIGSTSDNILTRLGTDEYLINFFENGNYVPELLRFERGKLSIQDFTYDAETTIFDVIENKKSIDAEFFELIILMPTIEEFDLINQKAIYTEPIIFKKSK